MDHEAYYQAIAADEAFSVALRRAYGARASQARYQYAHTNPEVLLTMRAKLAADEILRQVLAC